MAPFKQRQRRLCHAPTGHDHSRGGLAMQRLTLALGILLLAMGNTASAQNKTIKDVGDAIQALKGSNNAQDRAAALSVLAYMGTDGVAASKDVVASMFDNSQFVRQWAATALTKINPDLSGP